MECSSEPLLCVDEDVGVARTSLSGRFKAKFGLACVASLVAGSALVCACGVGGAPASPLAEPQATSLSADETCSKESVGSCLFFGCIEGRNAECVKGGCLCRPGFCAKQLGFLKGGTCSLEPGMWKANVAKVDFQYPYFPKPHNEIKTAICLSGGGARAASLTIGTLRALENLGLMPKVDAVSSISGSLFAMIPYMFADRDMYEHRDHFPSDEPMWGYPTTPSELTIESLDYHTSPLGTQFADGWGGVWGTAKEFLTTLLPSLTSHRHHVEAEWRNIMRKQFLEPFGLGKKDCFMALDDAAEARIRAANKHLDELCFYKPKHGKPKVFVIGAAILALAGEKKVDAASFQISPDWVGSPFYANISHRPHYVATSAVEGLNADVVGGGLVETFAFGGLTPAEQSAGLRDLSAPRRPFTLADAMATATYADFLPGQAIDWTPSYMYWPVGEGREEAKRFMIGDAGFIEDTGLLPMLQRRVGRIALFLHAGPGQQISNDVDYCSLSSKISVGGFDPQSFEPAGKIGDSLYTMFGYGYDDGMWHKSHNTVFKQEDMFEVACELQKLKQQGKPQVCKRTHEVQQNDYWGIRPYKVEIAYVYNDRIPEFEEQLPDGTQEALKKAPLKGFPTDLPAGLFMTPRIIKLMAAQSEYMVKQNEEIFRDLFRHRFW